MITNTKPSEYAIVFEATCEAHELSQNELDVVSGGSADEIGRLTMPNLKITVSEEFSD